MSGFSRTTALRLRNGSTCRLSSLP